MKIYKINDWVNWEKWLGGFWVVFYFKEEDRMVRIVVYLMGSIVVYKVVSVVWEF